MAIYPVDSAIQLLNIRHLAPVVQTLDSAIHRINHYPLDSVIDFRNTYLLDSDLSADSAIQRLNNRGLVDSTILLLNDRGLAYRGIRSVNRGVGPFPF